VSGCRREPPRIEWKRSLAAARELADAERKLIVVDLYTEWCAPCRKMDAETWPHPEVVAEKDRYVFLKLEAEKDPDGIALKKQCGIEGYPTILILDSDGREFERLVGFSSGPDFVKKLRSAVADPDSLGNLRQRETQAPRDLGLRFKLAKSLFDRSAFQEAQTRFERIAWDDPGNTSKVADLSLFFLAWCQYNQEQVEQALATIARLRKTLPQSAILPDSILLQSEILLRSGRRERARAEINDFLKRYPKHKLAEQARKLLAEI
jgi:thiol-disulfide isomerase/thioredoxin